MNPRAYKPQSCELIWACSSIRLMTSFWAGEWLYRAVRLVAVLEDSDRRELYTATGSEAWSMVEMTIQWLPSTLSIWAYSDVGKSTLKFCLYIWE